MLVKPDGAYLVAINSNQLAIHKDGMLSKFELRYISPIVVEVTGNFITLDSDKRVDGFFKAKL